MMPWKSVHIIVKGQGSGRETAIRAIESAGFEIISIEDITSVPHMVNIMKQQLE